MRTRKATASALETSSLTLTRSGPLVQTTTSKEQYLRENLSRTAADSVKATTDLTWYAWVLLNFQTCDITKGVRIFDQRQKPSPSSYRFEKPLGRERPQYSFGLRLPSPNDPKNPAHPGPSNYLVKPQTVLPGRYRKVGFGYGVKCTA